MYQKIQLCVCFTHALGTWHETHMLAHTWDVMCPPFFCDKKYPYEMKLQDRDILSSLYKIEIIYVKAN